MRTPTRSTATVVEFSSHSRVPVVGISASAGGIGALQEFVGSLPAHTGVAIVVAAHLDPSRSCELADSLQIRTSMPVVQLNGRIPLETDHVYVVPPDRRLLLSGRDIATEPCEENRGQRAPIDLFFRSVVVNGSGPVGAHAEELEASKGDLRSLNEGLQAANDELKQKLDTVSRLNIDLQNLLGATDIATLFLDKAMRIKSFTPRTTELFSLHAGDEGRPVSDFTHCLEYQNLISDAGSVLTNLAPVERTIHTVDDRWLTTRLRPYRTKDHKIEGVVVTFFDITERKRADAAWSEKQSLLVREFAHRVKNTLAVVQAIVNQTLKRSKAAAADPSLASLLSRRLNALALSHDLLVQSEWKDIDLRTLAQSQLAPYLADRRIQLSGAPVQIGFEITTPLGLVLHELATNAAKYGALSTEEGNVRLSWTVKGSAKDAILDIEWCERGGPIVEKAARKGLGTTLIERGICGATAESDYEPWGVTWKLHVPLGTRTAAHA